MLVLSRKAGEQIVIGENINITVVKINGQRVRLGIEAPKEVLINRQERQVAEAPQPVPEVPES